jgi:UDP-N-acetylmuramoyl-tripeptide--D-alanyl-D-alanine ligase
MLELGEPSAALHKDVSAALQHYAIDKLFAAGTLMKHLYDALPASMQGAYAKNAEALAPVVAKSLRAGDIVLIKGSNGSKMKLVTEKLLQSPTLLPA